MTALEHIQDSTETFRHAQHPRETQRPAPMFGVGKDVI